MDIKHRFLKITQAAYIYYNRLVKTTILTRTITSQYNFIIIISAYTVHVRTSAASHRRFRDLINTVGRTPLDE
jgi:ABC-type uncharacterized transport system fused permease/ATPase subunit